MLVTPCIEDWGLVKFYCAKAILPKFNSIEDMEYVLVENYLNGREHLISNQASKYVIST
jgi:hypothetical protein